MKKIRAHKFFLPTVISLLFVVGMIFIQMEIDRLPKSNLTPKVLKQNTALIADSIDIIARDYVKK